MKETKTMFKNLPLDIQENLNKRAGTIIPPDAIITARQGTEDDIDELMGQAILSLDRHEALNMISQLLNLFVSTDPPPPVEAGMENIAKLQVFKMVLSTIQELITKENKEKNDLSAIALVQSEMEN